MDYYLMETEDLEENTGQAEAWEKGILQTRRS
jgi:hypothetical protein